MFRAMRPKTRFCWGGLLKRKRVESLGAERVWAPASEGRRNQGACLEMQAGSPESQLLIRSKIEFYRDGERVICSKIRQFGLLVQSLGDGSLAEKGGCQLETAGAKYRSQVAVYGRWRSR